LTAGAALSATTPVTVTWWGDQWASLNSLSGGPAPSSFKGFAQSISSTPPACGATWTTGAGNSPPPPASVPASMAVIVTRAIAKTGSTIGGTISEIVVVKTNPTYAPGPGHVGTGTVVAVLCRSSDAKAQTQHRATHGRLAHVRLVGRLR